MRPWSRVDRPSSPSFWRAVPCGTERRRNERQASASSVSAAKLARSARRGSLEKTSTTGICEAEAALDHADVVLLVPEHERDGDAALPGAGGAAGAVEVGLVVLGRVVVDDDVDGVDVDAAGGDVGGDEHRELARR